jgi:membrane protein
VELLLERLDDAGLVHRDIDGDWLLSADLDAVTLGDLYRTMPLVLPVAEDRDLPETSRFDAPLRAALNEIDDVAGPLMRRSLKSYVNVDRAATEQRAIDSSPSTSTG